MTFGSLLSLTLIFKAVMEEDIRITTMTAAAKNGPLSPHTSSNFGSILVELTGDDAPSKRIFFSCNEGVYRPLNALMAK
jgi:hypothetical protein